MTRLKNQPKSQIKTTKNLSYLLKQRKEENDEESEEKEEESEENEKTWKDKKRTK